MAQKRHLYVEWTWQGNLEAFWKLMDDTFPSPLLDSPDGYDVVLAFVHCPDVEGILRQHARGALHKRMVPPKIIREFNLDRTVYFVEAVDKLFALSNKLRAFVAEREKCDTPGCLFTEVTSSLPWRPEWLDQQPAPDKKSIVEEDARALMSDKIKACRDVCILQGEVQTEGKIKGETMQGWRITLTRDKLSLRASGDGVERSMGCTTMCSTLKLKARKSRRVGSTACDVDIIPDNGEALHHVRFANDKEAQRWVDKIEELASTRSLAKDDEVHPRTLHTLHT